jgi:signal transduction histidine kinase
MKLRLRLALAAVAAALAMIVALQLIDLSRRREEGAGRLIANLDRLLADAGEQARCEASPAAWGPQGGSEPPTAPVIVIGRVRPPRRVHGRELPPTPRSSDREAPPSPSDSSSRDIPPPPPPPPLDPMLRPIELFVLDGELRAARPDGPALDRAMSSELAEADAIALPTRWWSDGVAVVVQTPWHSGPCAYVYARGHVRLLAGRGRPLWLLPLAGVMCAVLITIGPVVRRIRRLTDAVAASAATGFVAEIPVEGGDEIAELARSFAEASRAVRAQLSATEQREAALRDFLANTTHDVMIPLTVLQVHLAAMQADEQAGKPRTGATLTSAMDEAHYLGALLQNLAAVARLDSGAWRPVIGAVDMNALVHRVVSRHQAIARRLEVAVEFAVPDDPLTVAGDITLLEQAVSNVVYNAVRHNRAGGHVAVVLDAAAGDRFSLRVVDDGPGVAADELARLVERGFRSNAARTRSPDGLGLGLHIALRVAELHRLELRFGPSEYGGLQVDLDGPRTRADAAP